MATAVQPVVERENYLNSNYGIKSWLLTTDHKRIALLYLMSITAMFWLGGFFAMMIRLELLTPAGDLMTSDTYNKMFTMHGITMVFFFLIPSVPAVIGNFVIPLDGGRQGPGVPPAEPRKLVHLHDWRRPGAVGLPLRRHRYRLDLLHAVQHQPTRIRTSSRLPSESSSSASPRSSPA